MTAVATSCRMPMAQTPMRRVHLIDLVFLGDTNHHRTLFGGVALANMEEVAFRTASCRGRASFVTAASDKMDVDLPHILTMMNDRDHRIGQAFFMRCRPRSDIDRVTRDRVLPPGIEANDERSSWSVREPFGANAYAIPLGCTPASPDTADGAEAWQ